MSEGPLIIVSGPSASGKTTLIRRVLPMFDGRLRHSVSATTRDKRPGEQEGVAYHFWSQDRFEQGIVDGEFLEYAIVFGKNYYGTPRSEVEPYRKKGIGVILDIDVQGASQLRKTCPDGVFIFLLTPPGAYERRLRARGTESEEAIARRLEEASEELRHADDFDMQLVNDNLDRAATELAAVIGRLFKT